ncbi:MAG: hypothetical protein LW863_13790 [Flammeovirgaceae bacterium]|jgi:hypothetical protein|nr:hypothetical protein [Flammeovirgaceae bacterium]
MKQSIILAIIAILLSCQDEKVDAQVENIEKCPVTNENKIKDLKFYPKAFQDTLTINFQNASYELQWFRAETLTFAPTPKGNIKYQLNKRITSFGDGKSTLDGYVPGDLVCLITLYYPSDSVYFNNNSYLKKYQTKNSDTPNNQSENQLVFRKQCPFNLYLELTKTNGEKYKSVDRDSSTSHFFQIDSIKYVKDEDDKYQHAPFKVYAHFKTLLVDANNKQELITGELKVQLETNIK